MDFLKSHILFPTDFSKNAERALPFAAEIAYQTGQKLVLFHASQQTMDLAPDFEKTRDQIIDDTEQQFDKLINQLRENDRYKELQIGTILQSGQAVTSLTNHVAEDEPGLIVMGTLGATGERNAIMGNVATSVIQKSGVPVLAVPNGSKLDEFKNILFTTDYKEGDFAALEQTIRFAKIFDSTIDVLHIAEQKSLKSEIEFRGFRDLVKERTTYEKLDFHIRYELDFFPGVVDYVIEEPPSLMVLINYKKTFWEKLAERNHSKEMVFYSKVPLLVIPGREGVTEISREAIEREVENQ